MQTYEELRMLNNFQLVELYEKKRDRYTKAYKERIRQTIHWDNEQVRDVMAIHAVIEQADSITPRLQSLFKFPEEEDIQYRDVMIDAIELLSDREVVTCQEVQDDE